MGQSMSQSESSASWGSFYLDKPPAQCISRTAAAVVLHPPELVQVMKQFKLMT